MSDDNIQTNEASDTSHQSTVKWKGMGVALFIMGVGVLGFGFVMTSLYFERQMTQSKTSLQSISKEVNETQNHIQAMQARLEQLASIELSSESLRVSASKAVTEWESIQKGDVDKWRYAEVRYLTHLANDTLSLRHDVPMTINLLHRIEALLQHLSQDEVLPLKQAVKTALTVLSKVKNHSFMNEYSMLTELQTKVMSLPLRPILLKPDVDQSKEIAEQQSVWQKVWTQCLKALNRLVIVRRMDDVTASPLVLPDEKPFLYQNMVSQLAEAKWALLHRNQMVYQTSVDQLIAWMNTYFDADAPETKSMLTQLKSMREADIGNQSYDLATMVQLVDQELPLK